MDQVFRAGRALGRAEVLRLIPGKEGSAQLREAATCLQSTGNPALRAVTDTLNRIAMNWNASKDQIPGITGQIQAVGPKEYHAVSAGIWLGIAMESCVSGKKDDPTSECKAAIADRLEKARAHVEALRLQGILPNMPDFNTQFRAEVSGVSLVRQTSELTGHFGLIQNLSNQVGNAIH